MSTTTIDPLDPTKVRTSEDVVTWMGHARTAMIEAHKAADKVGTIERTVADLVEGQRRIEEAQTAPRAVVREMSGGDAEMVRRYVRPDGTVRLSTERTPVTLRGASRTIQVPDVDQPGLLDDPHLCGDWHRDMQRLINERKMVRTVGVSHTPYIDGQIAGLLLRAPASIRDAVQRAFVDSAGSGAEWIPDTFSADLYAAYEVPTVLAGLLPTVTLAGPTIKPKLTGQARPYKLSEITSDDPAVLTASSITTGSQTLDAAGLYVRLVVGRIAAEDSALPVIALVQQQLLKTLADGYEDAMVNGDTTATHQDAIATWNIRSRWGASGLGGVADHRRSMMGWRRIAVDRSATTDQSAGQTVVKILEELIGGHMGEIAAARVGIVTSPEVYFKKLILDSNVLTVDKFGPAATILTGQVGAVGGRPVIVSRFVSADLHTNGLYTGANSHSGVLAVALDAFSHYQRRGAGIEVTSESKTQAIHIVATQRKGMDTLSASTEKVVGYGYKWL